MYGVGNDACDERAGGGDAHALRMRGQRVAVEVGIIIYKLGKRGMRLLPYQVVGVTTI